MFSSLISNLKISFHTENIYLKKSFSLNGEDILIESVLKEVDKGFYLDIGAHHPFRFSNTYLLYKKGWNGINIDASQISIELLNKYRSRDTNLKYVVSDTQQEVILYSNHFGATNTIDKEIFKSGENNYNEATKVQTHRVDEILKKHMPISTRIDFLNIDIEGSDLKALSSFPWENQRPKLVCVEDLKFDFEDHKTSQVYKYLNQMNYKLFAFIPKTLLFIPL